MSRGGTSDAIVRGGADGTPAQPGDEAAERAWEALDGNQCPDDGRAPARSEPLCPPRRAGREGRVSGTTLATEESCSRLGNAAAAQASAPGSSPRWPSLPCRPHRTALVATSPPVTPSQPAPAPRMRRRRGTCRSSSTSWGRVPVAASTRWSTERSRVRPRTRW